MNYRIIKQTNKKFLLNPCKVTYTYIHTGKKNYIFSRFGILRQIVFGGFVHISIYYANELLKLMRENFYEIWKLIRFDRSRTTSSASYIKQNIEQLTIDFFFLNFKILRKFLEIIVIIQRREGR